MLAPNGPQSCLTGWQTILRTHPPLRPAPPPTPIQLVLRTIMLNSIPINFEPLGAMKAPKPGMLLYFARLLKYKMAARCCHDGVLKQALFQPLKLESIDSLIPLPILKTFYKSYLKMQFLQVLLSFALLTAPIFAIPVGCADVSTHSLCLVTWKHTNCLTPYRRLSNARRLMYPIPNIIGQRPGQSMSTPQRQRYTRLVSQPKANPDIHTPIATTTSLTGLCVPARKPILTCWNTQSFGKAMHQ